MARDSLINQDWASVVERLGGAEALAVSARTTKAFLRPRVVRTASDLLRLVLAYCRGEEGLRLTAAWAGAIGLADLSNVALLQRLRRCGDWLGVLVGQALGAGGGPGPVDPAARCDRGGAGGGGGAAISYGASTAPSICLPNASAASC